MNRGSAFLRVGTEVGIRRFNEAPIHESGKSLRERNDDRIRTRFNEAPIHESGKYARREGPQFVESGFNEAPIHESGK